MCRVYRSTEPRRYKCTTRSIRLEGYVTSIRLENEFWDILELLAADQGLTAPQFISRLYNERVEDYGEVRNHTSMLRVACVVYLQNQTSLQLAI